MVHLAFPLFILSLGGPPQTAPVSAAAVNVVSWDFEAAGDTDYDGWPDGWSRWRGAEYPPYVGIEIAAAPDASAGAPNRCLRIDLDGGAGRIDSPPVDVHPDYSYLIQARLQTLGIRHDRARVAVTFYDAQGEALETHLSNGPPTNGVWCDVQIGPIAPTSSQVRRAVVSLRLEPDQEADLSGSALFDEVSVARLPRMTLQTDRENSLCLKGQDVEVTCRVSGFSLPNLVVRFELLDVEGSVLCKHEQAAQPDAGPSDGDSHGVPVRPSKQGEACDVLNGTARWKPPLTTNGFYQVRVSLAGHTASMVTNLAVLEDFPVRSDGEFGWSLPRGEAPLSLRSLGQLAGRVGIHWLKFPVWYDEQSASRGEDLAQFAERLSNQHVRLVGVLDAPPKSIRDYFEGPEPLPIASVFVDPAVWRPALDPILTRLSLAVRWWQLGADRDTSFAGLPELETKLGQVREELNRFGHNLDLGLSWRSVDEMPPDKSCSFLALAARPEPTAEELLHMLSGDLPGGTQRWVTLEPLSRRDYGLRAQVRDLVLRMLAAKQAGARGIFLADPFAADRGLMTPDGAPDALLVPWRTTSLLLTGSSYLGSLQLPGGSPNRVFSRGSEAVVVVWNDRPQRETLQLGPSARQVDVWGNLHRPQSSERDGMTGQEADIDDLPSFFITTDPQLVYWSMAVKFEPAVLDSVFGQEQTVVCRFANTFPMGVTGSVTLRAPDVWEFNSRKLPFKLREGEQNSQPFPILLGANASSGRQPVRLDFAIAADREHRFSVYRELNVGRDDVRVELQSHLDEHGNLLVEQQLINESNRAVSFSCLLFAPERRRERQQVVSPGGGRVTKTFVLPEGRQLIGRTLWLRAEEIDGARILNYHVIAQE